MASADISLERTMPNSVESERPVLGAILLEEKAIFAAAEILTSDGFYLEAHREIFRAMLSLAEEEFSIDYFTLREELRRHDKEELAGGTAYIAGLTVYAARKSIVEPVFGQVKHARGFRQFLLRGIEKLKAEWALVCMTHNILKLYRMCYA
jgi:replicative DNA helicase